MKRLNDRLGLRGEVRTYQTELDEHGNDTGRIVPGSDSGYRPNTIQEGVQKWLAMAIGLDTLTADGVDISSGDLPKYNIYKVNTSTIVQNGITIPVGTVFVSDGTTVTWGTGKVQTVVDTLAANDLFDSEDETTQEGKDGIAFSAQSDDFDDIVSTLITTLNVGGDGTETYIEYYGYITGAFSLNGSLVLGSDLAAGGASLGNKFATQVVSATVAANRRYHVYWKISLS